MEKVLEDFVADSMCNFWVITASLLGFKVIDQTLDYVDHSFINISDLLC